MTTDTTKLLSWARRIIGADIVATRHMSGDNSLVYELSLGNQRWFLKIASHLRPEHDRLMWLQNRLPVPSVVGFYEDLDANDMLLITALSGRSLAALRNVWPAERVVSKLAEGLRFFHALTVAECPFGEQGDDTVIVHGDACLPNMIFDAQTGELGGFIDLGEMTIAAAEVDLSAAVWSLQFNMGAGYGQAFLTQYGISPTDDATVDRLYQLYAQRT